MNSDTYPLVLLKLGPNVGFEATLPLSIKCSISLRSFIRSFIFWQRQRQSGLVGTAPTPSHWAPRAHKAVCLAHYCCHREHIDINLGRTWHHSGEVVKGTYRKEVEHLVSLWNNNLMVTTSENTEGIVDLYGRSLCAHLQISDSLTWSENISVVGPYRHFLRKLKQSGHWNILQHSTWTAHQSVLKQHW